MSQTSHFQAPKAWELSAYELQRTPQAAITDDVEVAISPRALHSELMCPICLDMLTETMTTKECLHRFCHDCIITALRSGNKECPTCRKKLVSKRSLRPDPNFDSLIEKIYPDRDEYDAHQQRVLEKLNQHTNQQALTSSIEEGLQLQAQSRLQRMLKQQMKKAEEMDMIAENDVESEAMVHEAAVDSASDPAATTSTPKTKAGSKRSRPSSAHSASHSASNSAANLASNSAAHSVDPTCSTVEEVVSSDVELILWSRERSTHGDSSDQSIKNQGEGSSSSPMPDAESSTELQKCSDARYIKTTGIATMCHIGKYLSMRMSIEGSTDHDETLNDQEIEKTFIMSIITPGDSDHTELPGDMTLDDVNSNYWKQNKPIDLYYIIDTPPSSTNHIAHDIIINQ